MAHVGLLDLPPGSTAVTATPNTIGRDPEVVSVLTRAVTIPLLGAALLAFSALPIPALAADAQSLVDALKAVVGKPPGQLHASVAPSRPLLGRRWQPRSTGHSQERPARLLDQDPVGWR